MLCIWWLPDPHSYYFRINSEINRKALGKIMHFNSVDLFCVSY